MSTRKGEVSIDASRRGLEMLTDVAAMTSNIMRDKMNDYAAALGGEGGRSVARGLVLTRAYDATPMFCKFGSMQGQLVKCARYLKLIPADRETGYARWTTISYEQWLKENPHMRMPQSGSLEVFTMNAVASVPTFDDIDTWQDTFQVETQPLTLPLRIISRGTASCTFSAMEKMMNNLDSDGLLRLAKAMHDLRDDGGVLLIDDVPDNAKSNLLLKKKFADIFKAESRILYIQQGRCLAHLLHTLIVKLVGEEKVIRHAHAYQHVLTIHARRSLLLAKHAAPT